MWFKGGFVFWLDWLCECLLRWNNLCFAVLYITFVIPIPFKTTLSGLLNVFKSQLTI